MAENATDPQELMAKSSASVPQAFERLLAAAQPGAVFGAPVQSGDYTLITASEVMAGGGFGTGFGMGGPDTDAERAADSQPAAGGGGGGGGGSSGRPVAAISIGPDGVQVKPIVDVTKLGLAALTAWGAMLLALLRMRAASTR